MKGKNPETLTPSETRVARLILRGVSNKDISEELNLAETSVKVYAGRVYAKKGVHGRAEFIARHLRGSASM